jgi:hypothetical protein
LSALEAILLRHDVDCGMAEQRGHGDVIAVVVE